MPANHMNLKGSRAIARSAQKPIKQRACNDASQRVLSCRRPCSVGTGPAHGQATTGSISGRVLSIGWSAASRRRRVAVTSPMLQGIAQRRSRRNRATTWFRCCRPGSTPLSFELDGFQTRATRAQQVAGAYNARSTSTMSPAGVTRSHGRVVGQTRSRWSRPRRSRRTSSRT